MLALLALLGAQQGARAEALLQNGSAQEAAAPASEPQPGPFLYELAPGRPKIAFPRDEVLVYDVYVDFMAIEASVGTVTQRCQVKQQEALLMVEAQAGEAASIALEAEGEVPGYKLRSTLTTRALPQSWPQLYYLQETESRRGRRRREILLGLQEEKPVSSYRGDTSRNAPPGERIWREPRLRAVPAGTIDMLTAVLLARTLIRDKEETLTFPLIDTDRLWKLVLRRGKEARIETNAGTFEAVEVVLEPEPYPGEDMQEKAEQFAGVFGIHGTIHLWVERRTGVAVRIQGEIPILDGTFNLGADVTLKSFTGTPGDFAPIAGSADK